MITVSLDFTDLNNTIAKMQRRVENSWVGLRTQAQTEIGEAWKSILFGTTRFQELRYTGELEESIGYRIEDADVYIGPNANGEIVEESKLMYILYGGPGRVEPIEPLTAWVQGKLGQTGEDGVELAELIQFKINTKGTSTHQKNNYGGDYNFVQEVSESEDFISAFSHSLANLIRGLVKAAENDGD